MSSANHVGSNLPTAFGNYPVGAAVSCPVGATGNAVATIPVLGGGLTPNTGSFILRRITVSNANADASVATVRIMKTNDGNTSNAITSLTTLSNCTTKLGFNDCTISAPYAAASALNVSALYVLVGTAANASTTTVNVRVYGDFVNL